MNRILVDSNKSNIKKIIDDKVIVNIDSNCNLLIDNSYSNYDITINNSKVNILLIREKQKDISIKINVNKGDLSFNSISYYKGNLNLDIDLNKDKSNVLVNNSVIAKEKINYNINVNHNHKNTNSNIYNNGITKDLGSITFDVVSKVFKGSIKSNVNQDSKIITLNDVNDNMINPVLLIDEYDSSSRHSAFIGNFNEKELFYLESRGLSKKEASSLLINGMLIGTLDLCFDEKEKLKEKLRVDWR